MPEIRHRRRDTSRPGSSSPSRVNWVTLVGVAGAAGLVALVVGLIGAVDSGAPQRRSSSATAAESTPSISVATSSPQPSMVEVPDVVGMARVDAEVILGAAGLSVTIESEVPSASVTAESAKVASQDPPAGTLVDASSSVLILIAPPRVAAKATATAAQVAAPTWVVCIDPGHQAKGDSSPEPVGPGSKETKARVTGGATGVRTGIPEYEMVLQISMNLKEELESRGVKVVMTRTTNDVNISNSERAGVANKADADVFVRIHCDGSPDSERAGVSTLYPASNKWTSSIAASSKKAARAVQRSVVRTTGAVDLGARKRSDLSGFNWAEVPSVLVECGFLSNPVEDRLLASPHYQDKIASGIADGILAYLEGEGR